MSACNIYNTIIYIYIYYVTGNPCMCVQHIVFSIGFIYYVKKEHGWIKALPACRGTVFVSEACWEGFNLQSWGAASTSGIPGYAGWVTSWHFSMYRNAYIIKSICS